MKKLLIILIVFLTSGKCFAQFPKPAGVHQVPSYYVFKNNTDSTITIAMGSIDLFNTLLSKFDSVKVKGYATNFKLLSYKQIKDSTNRISGYATLWKLTHELDSVMTLVKYRNDSINLSGYFTNYKALSKVDKITGYSLIRNTLRDSIPTALFKKDSTLYVTPYKLLQSLPQGYEFEIVTAGVTMLSLPFTLSDRTLVFYNGSVLSKTLWSGVGTANVTLMIDTKQKDLLKIQNQ